MLSFTEVKISNSQRVAKRERKKKQQLVYNTPEKYLNKQSTFRTFYKLQKKYGYDYDVNESKTLKYLKQDFQNKTVAYLGKGQWTKNWGTKDKYEKNLQNGRVLKMNPLILTFGKIERKIIHNQKVQGLNALKSLKK